jgi:hypothetical protein
LVVHRSEDLPEAAIEEVLLGVEEEGIPYRVATSSTTDVRLLAHEAALSSRLDVGIGATVGQVAVTTEKLPPDKPYIEAQLNALRATDRAVGANAARLVKRVPLMKMGEL